MLAPVGPDEPDVSDTISVEDVGSLREGLEGVVGGARRVDGGCG